MAKAYICDRCGEFYSPLSLNVGEGTKSIALSESKLANKYSYMDGAFILGTYDLCEKCYEDIYDYLNDPHYQIKWEAPLMGAE